jgi:uncharacterized membrane protein
MDIFLFAVCAAMPFFYQLDLLGSVMLIVFLTIMLGLTFLRFFLLRKNVKEIEKMVTP